MLTEIREWLNFVFEGAILYVLIVEYWFDKKIYEQKRKKIKRTKDKVVVAYENGQIVIKEQPKDIKVTIEHDGENK